MSEAREAIEAILSGSSVEDAIDEAAALRGVKAKGVLNQKQARQLIVNGKARGLMKQAMGFLEKAVHLGCPASENSLEHLKQAMAVLEDVCEGLDEAIKDYIAPGTWYRNVGSTEYHLVDKTYMKSGKAVCGAGVGAAGYTARSLDDIKRSTRTPCKACLTKV